jgi:hypothetical protein
LDETPRPENILAEMQLDNATAPLRERRDLLKLRYLRQVERIYERLIVKGGDEKWQM